MPCSARATAEIRYRWAAIPHRLSSLALSRTCHRPQLCAVAWVLSDRLPCVGAGQIALVRCGSHRRRSSGASARQGIEGAHRQDFGRHIDAARNTGRNAADAWLLPSPRTAGHLTRQATADRMRRWGQQAGVQLHPHRLRHNMKRKGSCAASIFSRCRRRSGIATAVLPPGLCGRQSSRQQQLAAGLTCYLELAATPSKNERHIKLLRSLTAQEGNAFGSHDSCC